VRVLARHDNEVSESRLIHGATSTGTQDDRNLGNQARGLAGLLEDAAVLGQCDDTLLDAGAARILNADDRNAHADAAVDQVNEAGDLLITALNAGIAKLPERTWWDSVKRTFTSVVVGAVEAVVDLAKLLWKLGGGEAWMDFGRILMGDMTLEEYDIKHREIPTETLAAMAKALWNDPVGFMKSVGKALLDWDTWTDDVIFNLLIDEIENAGIDRKKALDLLVSQDKIVLMATHDPLLALMADRRIVIKNGGIDKIIETTAEEKEVLVQLNSIDEIMQEARKRLRAGMTLEGELCQEVIHNPHSLGE